MRIPVFHVKDDTVVSLVFVVLLLKLVQQKSNVHTNHQRGHRQPQIAREQHVEVVE